MFSYECWKCPKKHRATMTEACYLFANGFARIGLTIAGRFIPLQTNRSVFAIRDLRERLERANR